MPARRIIPVPVNSILLAIPEISLGLIGLLILVSLGQGRAPLGFLISLAGGLGAFAADHDGCENHEANESEMFHIANLYRKSCHTTARCYGRITAPPVVDAVIVTSVA